MKRIFILHVLLFSTGICSNAQFSIPTVASSMFSNSASNYFPSDLGTGIEHWRIETSINVWTGTQGIPIGSVHSFLKDNYISTEDYAGYFMHLGFDNFIAVRADVQPITIAFNISGAEKESSRTCISFGVRDRVAANAFFTDTLLMLAFNGNAPYAGQTIHPDIPGINSLYYREFSAGASHQFKPFSLFSLKKEMQIILGAKIKYLEGFAFTQMDKSDASLYTDPDGRYLDINVDEQMFYSGVETYANQFDFPIPKISSDILKFKPRGKGVALDMGATIFLGLENKISFSLTDLGRLTFHNVNLYSANGDFRFEGVEIDNVLADVTNDTIGNMFNYIQSENSNGGNYSPQLPARFSLRYERIFDLSKFSHAFPKGVAGAVYSCALKAPEHSVNSNFLSLSYAVWFKNVANAGMTFTIGGYERSGVGFFLSGKLGCFLIGAGVSNLSTWYSMDSYKGGNANFNFGFTF